MKTFTITLLIFSCYVTTCCSQVFFKHKIQDSNSVIGTFSQNLANNSSAHFVFTKTQNKKKYAITPFFVNNLKEVIEFQKIPIDHKPKILSCHKNDSILTFTQHKGITLDIFELDMVSKKLRKTSSEKRREPDNIFKLPNKTIFVTKNPYADDLEIMRIKSIDDHKIYDYSFKKNANLDVLVSAFLTPPTVVNTSEYVKNGPISKGKSFYEKDHYYVVYLKKRNKSTQLIDFKLETNNNPNVTTYNSETPLLNTSASYIFKNKLFKIDIDKEDAFVLKIYNLTNDKSYKLSSKEQLVSIFKNTDQQESFYNYSKKKGYQITLTVNETQKGNFKVLLGYVKINTYNYHHDFMFHQMMFQQQMQMQNGFGPNSNYEVYFETKPPKNLEFTLNQSFELTIDNSPTIHRDIDKKFQAGVILNNQNHKYPSMAFFRKEFYYIYFNKKNNEIEIGTTQF